MARSDTSRQHVGGGAAYVDEDDAVSRKSEGHGRMWIVGNEEESEEEEETRE